MISQTLRLNLYQPHAGQVPLHLSRKRFNIVCFGRQSGKTTYGLNKIADRAWRSHRDSIHWYILQTYDAADVAFQRMYQMYRDSPSAFDKKPNESDLFCRFRHGPAIGFKSGRNFEDLRVETLDGVVIDEYRQQDPRLWPMVIRPMLSAKKGWADILSTPNGYEHFYDLFEAARTDPDWGSFHAPSTIAPWWTPEEVASARRTMSEAEFAQEILAEFRDLHTGKAYISFTRENLLTQNPFAASGEKLSPFLPIVVGLDFNVNPMAWVLGQNRGPDWYWFNEIYVRNTNTQECAKELVSRVKGHKPGVILVGDASGNARKTSASGTDYTIITAALNEAGIRWENRTPESNPLVKDRVNTVNSRLMSADGTRHMFINREGCPMLVRDLDRVSWKQGIQVMLDQQTNSDLTHASDAMGYPVCVLSPMQANGGAGIMRVVRR